MGTFLGETIKYCIVLAFHPHGNGVSGHLKRYFLRTGPRVERSGNAASVLPCRQGNRYFVKTMTSPSRCHRHVTRRKTPTCTQQPVTTTTTMADITAVFVLQALLSLLALLQQNLVVLYQLSISLSTEYLVRSALSVGLQRHL